MAGRDVSNASLLVLIHEDLEIFGSGLQYPKPWYEIHQIQGV